MLQRSRKSTTNWNLLFHYISIFLSIVSGIVLVPMYLHHIPVALYGAWLASSNVIAWLAAIDPGLSTVLQQKIARSYGQHDKNSVIGYAISGLLITFVVAALLVLLGLFISTWIPEWVGLAGPFERDELSRALIIAVWGTGLFALSFALTSINQGLQSSLGIGLIYTLVHVIDIALVIVLLYFNYGLISLAISVLFRGAAMLVGNLIYLIIRLRRESYRFSFIFNDKFGELINLMPFTFTAQLSGAIANNGDAFLVARLLGAELVPVFIFTRKASDILKLILTRPILAVTPALSHLQGEFDESKISKLLKKLLSAFVLLLVISGAGLIFFNQSFVNIWVGNKFYAGSSINLMIALGMIASIFSQIFLLICTSLGSIKKSSVASLIQNLILVASMIFGGAFFGMEGIAIAPIFASVAVGCWYFPMLLMNKLRASDFNLKFLIPVIILSVGIAIILAIPFIDRLEKLSLIDFTISVLLYIFSYSIMLIGTSKKIRELLFSFLK